ncbi:MAG: DnaA ATPase domain-containing protein, partial [Gammaproteobacteria bacterium]
MNTWDLIKQTLERRLSTQAYQNWISKTGFSRVENKTLWVTVPNEETRVWMESEYGEVIAPAVRAAGLERVSFELAGTVGRSDIRELVFEGSTAQLNPKFTFENFVVGSCNQFAHAAAQSVASAPSRSYNPLFIYGGVGMGKTHLMHAVGRSLMNNYTSMKIVYTSSERFMNEMITCIRLERMPHFHAHYRSADVLLVDDI